MDPRLHFITLSTPDLEAARAFYRDGLGWEPLMDVADEILFFQVAPGLVLGLFDARTFTQDLAQGDAPAALSGVTLSHNVGSPDDVRSVVQSMTAAGGQVLKAPQQGEFGGIFHAHVQDPNGVIWEIAHNPAWRIAEDGTVVLDAPAQ